MVATSDIALGEEITRNFEARSNLHLLQKYGYHAGSSNTIKTGNILKDGCKRSKNQQKKKKLIVHYTSCNYRINYFYSFISLLMSYSENIPVNQTQTVCLIFYFFTFVIVVFFLNFLNFFLNRYNIFRIDE